MFRLFNSQAGFREILLAAALLHSAVKLEVDQRYPKLIGLQESAGAIFATQKIVVVGVGSIGRRIALHLARHGIGVLWLIDPDRFDDRANLLTQEIHSADLGHSKAVSTGQVCKDVSPSTRVLVYEGKLQDLDPVSMAEADIVFLATDNLAVEVDASNQFRLLGIPIIQASVHGETLVVQVRFVENQQEDSPCLVCAFGKEEYRHLNQSSVFRCSGDIPNGRPSEQINVMPTISTSFLCSLAADFAMTQWTRHLLDLGQPVADTLLQYCGYTHRLNQTGLIRNKNCTSGHMVLESVVLQKNLGECTAHELAQTAGFEDQSLEGCSFTFGNLSYIESAVCLCNSYGVEKFIPNGETIDTCSACGEQITPQPYYSYRPISGIDINSQRNRALKELGVAETSWAVVRGDERGVLLFSDTKLKGSKDNDQEVSDET